MIIDGRSIARDIRARVKASIDPAYRVPKVVAFIVGADPAAESYLKMLTKSCEGVGMAHDIIRLPATCTEAELVTEIEARNADETVDGIIVQMPLPRHISEKRILMALDPEKDIDGFHPLNAGRLFKGEPAMKPCTAQAVVEILKAMDVSLQGKHVVIIGRSNIVGKPLSVLLTGENATVTLCHSKTRDIAAHTRAADIVVVAVGIPHFLKADMVRPESIVIDVGMNSVDGKLVGDADYDAMVETVAMMTPVPGGVGPVTNAMLLGNVMTHYEAHKR